MPRNGIMERKHRHILEVARALKLKALVPNKYWGFCALTTCYLINVVPSSIFNGISPYEAL